MRTTFVSMIRALAITTLTVLCSVAWCAGPVALVGGGYGKYVRNSIIKKSLLPLGIAYEDFGDTMDFSRLSEFSLVIVAHGDEKLREGGDPGPAFEEYVRGGGHVLLTANAPMVLFDTRSMEDHPWIGANSWVYDSANPMAPVVAADHPWLVHLDAATDYYWLSASQLLATPATASLLMGTEDRAYLTYNEYGEGWTTFLARGPFPFTREDVGPERDAQVAMLDAIILAAEPSTFSDQIAEAMADSDQQLMVWERDWQFGSKEGPQFRPPWPEDEEETTVIAFDLARAEREDLALNLLPLTDAGPLTVTVSDLTLAGAAGPSPAIDVRVMQRAPLIPWEKPNVQAFESPFWLVDPNSLPPEGSPAFEAPALSNTVVWLQAYAPEDCAHGVWQGEVTVAGASEQTFPIEVTVWPVLSPQDRLFQLKFWGGSAPDVRQWDELGRQGACNASLSYPDREQVMVSELGISLEEALTSSPEVFARVPFPRLDFSYLDQHMGMQAARGLTVVRFQDIRTGTEIANAATGLQIEWREAWGDQVTEEWQRIWVAYYTQLMDYLRTKGFRRAEPIWTDEPTVESIVQRYLPLAELYVRAGMFPGSNWTTPGFMSPDDVNTFAHAVGDWSMYSIMMPNFFGFVDEGTVKLINGARVGQTRGGYGFLHRAAPDTSRRGCWDAWHNRATYIRTGPLWKSWIYYANYELSIRDEGIAGERLFAYSTPDATDLSAPMLPCPDWIAAREGADDANLLMVLQWYIARLREMDVAPADLLADIEREVGEMVGNDSPYKLHPEPRHYELVRADLAYDYTSVVDATSADMRRARRRVFEMLDSLAPYAAQVPVELAWNEVMLADAGRALGGVHCLTEHRDKAYELSAWLALRTGLDFSPSFGLDADRPGIFLAVAGDDGLAKLAEAHAWDLDAWTPAVGSYSILTDGDAHAVAVIGGDDAGLEQGIAAFRSFASPRGHWLPSK